MLAAGNDGEEAGDREETWRAMRYHATQPLARRLQAIDRGVATASKGRGISSLNPLTRLLTLLLILCAGVDETFL
jgi:hypothetical protein